MKGKGKKVGRPYWSLPVARRVVPSEIWYAEPVTYQDVLHSTRSPTWMAVADGETFDRLHPLAAPSDANAVALRFALPSPWKMARVVDVYSLPVGVLKTSTIQFDPSDDGCTLTPIACGVPPGPVIRPYTITYRNGESTRVKSSHTMIAYTGVSSASTLRMIIFICLYSC